MIILLTLLIGWFFTPLVKAQTHGECLRYRIVSYNVENLFDCLDDSLKAMRSIFRRACGTGQADVTTEKLMP